jgi:hypothetical protein
MSILQETEKPFFYAVVYTSAPRNCDGPSFRKTASMLVAMAATEPGYLGFETQYAAEGRTVAVCYWDSYASLARWTEKAEGWTPGDPGLDALLCTTGCLWPWLLEERQVNLETAARSVA